MNTAHAYENVFGMEATIDAFRGELRTRPDAGWEVRTFVVLTHGDRAGQEWSTGADWMTYEVDMGVESLKLALLDTLESVLYDLSMDDIQPPLPPTLTATWTAHDVAAEQHLVVLGLTTPTEIDVPPDIRPVAVDPTDIAPAPTGPPGSVLNLITIIDDPPSCGPTP